MVLTPLMSVPPKVVTRVRVAGSGVCNGYHVVGATKEALHQPVAQGFPDQLRLWLEAKSGRDLDALDLVEPIYACLAEMWQTIVGYYASHPTALVFFGWMIFEFAILAHEWRKTCTKKAVN